MLDRNDGAHKHARHDHDVEKSHNDASGSAHSDGAGINTAKLSLSEIAGPTLLKGAREEEASAPSSLSKTLSQSALADLLSNDNTQAPTRVKIARGDDISVSNPASKTLSQSALTDLLSGDLTSGTTRVNVARADDVPGSNPPGKSLGQSALTDLLSGGMTTAPIRVESDFMQQFASDAPPVSPRPITANVAAEAPSSPLTNLARGAATYLPGDSASINPVASAIAANSLTGNPSSVRTETDYMQQFAALDAQPLRPRPLTADALSVVPTAAVVLSPAALPASLDTTTLPPKTEVALTSPAVNPLSVRSESSYMQESAAPDAQPIRPRPPTADAVPAALTAVYATSQLPISGDIAPISPPVTPLVFRSESSYMQESAAPDAQPTRPRPLTADAVPAALSAVYATSPLPISGDTASISPPVTPLVVRSESTYMQAFTQPDAQPTRPRPPTAEEVLAALPAVYAPNPLPKSGDTAPLSPPVNPLVVRSESIYMQEYTPQDAQPTRPRPPTADEVAAALPAVYATNIPKSTDTAPISPPVNPLVVRSESIYMQESAAPDAQPTRPRPPTADAVLASAPAADTTVQPTKSIDIALASPAVDLPHVRTGPDYMKQFASDIPPQGPKAVTPEQAATALPESTLLAQLDRAARSGSPLSSPDGASDTKLSPSDAQRSPEQKAQDVIAALSRAATIAQAKEADRDGDAKPKDASPALVPDTSNQWARNQTKPETADAASATQSGVSPPRVVASGDSGQKTDGSGTRVIQPAPQSFARGSLNETISGPVTGLPSDSRSSITSGKATVDDGKSLGPLTAGVPGTTGIAIADGGKMIGQIGTIGPVEAGKGAAAAASPGDTKTAPGGLQSLTDMKGTPLIAGSDVKGVPFVAGIDAKGAAAQLGDPKTAGAVGGLVLDGKGQSLTDATIRADGIRLVAGIAISADDKTLDGKRLIPGSKLDEKIQTGDEKTGKSKDEKSEGSSQTRKGRRTGKAGDTRDKDDDEDEEIVAANGSLITRGSGSSACTNPAASDPNQMPSTVPQNPNPQDPNGTASCYNDPTAIANYIQSQLPNLEIVDPLACISPLKQNDTPFLPPESPITPLASEGLSTENPGPTSLTPYETVPGSSTHFDDTTLSNLTDPSRSSARSLQTEDGTVVDSGKQPGLTAHIDTETVDSSNKQPLRDDNETLSQSPQVPNIATDDRPLGDQSIADIARAFGQEQEPDGTTEIDRAAKLEILNFDRNRVYKIRKGDTIESIAIRQLGDVRLAPLILQLNRAQLVGDKHGKVKLKPGVVIRMPSRSEALRYLARLDDSSSLEYAHSQESVDRRITYTCRLGDTLKSIAKRHPGINDARMWPLIARLNDLDATRTEHNEAVLKLKRGQRLTLPNPDDCKQYLQQLTFGSSGPINPSDNKPPGENDKGGWKVEFWSQYPADTAATSHADETAKLHGQTTVPSDSSKQGAVPDPKMVSSASQTIPPNQQLASNGDTWVSSCGTSSDSDTVVTPDTAPSHFITRILTQSDLGEASEPLTLRLEMKLGGQWAAVVNYSVSGNGGRSSISVYTRSGRDRTIKIELPDRAARELAENDLAANSSSYCKNYLANQLPF